MDANGWVDLGEFITAVAIRNRRFRFLKPNHVLGLVQTDPKGRYEFRDGRIRATYGHSLDVDLDLPTDAIPDVLFYPTSEEECNVLLGAGIRPSDRKMVHLRGTFTAALEARRVRIQVPVIVAIDAETEQGAGLVVTNAGKSVCPAKKFPPAMPGRF